MQKRNGGSNMKKPVLANKIGSIFSSACARSRGLTMSFGFGIEENEKGDGGNESDTPGSASFSKTHPCDQVQAHAADSNSINCLQLASRRLSGILANSGLRKWKSSLKKVARVKIRIKTTGKEGKTVKAEAKTELELCKKRILMGEKCRALNLSGVLHYDKQGVLLAED